MERFIVSRLAMPVLALLALAGTAAADEDNAALLVNLFAKTCGMRPALPSELERLAAGLGFESSNGPITAEMEAGPQVDIVYAATWTEGNGKASLSAFFNGPINSPTVACGVRTTGVSPETLPGLVEISLNAHDRTNEATGDPDMARFTWHAGAAESGDTLEVSTRKAAPRRAAIDMTYTARKQ